MKFRLTESDLQKLVSSAVNKILKEEIENNELISTICQRITELQSEIDWTGHEGDIEVPLDDSGDMVAFVSYEVEDNRVLAPGQRSLDRDVPDDPDNIEGDYKVYVNDIAVYTEDGDFSVEDNGMVAKLLQSLVDPSTDNLEYYNDDDQSGFNDSWR